MRSMPFERLALGVNVAPEPRILPDPHHDSGRVFNGHYRPKPHIFGFIIRPMLLAAGASGSPGPSAAGF